MRINEITVTQTVQLNQYEPLVVSMTAQLDSTECALECTASLRGLIEQTITGTFETATPTETKEAPKKKRAPKTKAVEAEVVEEVKEEAPVKKEKKERKKKVVKNTPYDRTEQTHKDEFAAILNEHCSGWKASAESKGLAKQASIDLTGTDVFDGKGEVLVSFIDAVKEAMSEDEL